MSVNITTYLREKGFFPVLPFATQRAHVLSENYISISINLFYYHCHASDGWHIWKRLRGQCPKLRDKKDVVYVFLSLCSMRVSMTRVLNGADGLGPAGLCFFL